MHAASVMSSGRLDLSRPYRIEVRELRYFVALAEELNHARAAQRVGINQSPLSRSIDKLEHTLRVQLFQRTRQRTTLTLAGEMLLPYARVVLLDMDRVEKDAAALASGRKGRLRIGVADGLSASGIGLLLATSAQKEVVVEMSVEHCSLVEQMQALRHDRLDVGLAPSPATDLTPNDFDLQAIALRHESVCVAMRPDHILSDQAVVRSLDAITGPFLLAGDPAVGAGEIAGLVQPAEAADTCIHYVPTVDSLVTAVQAGRGIGLLSAPQAQRLAGSAGIVFRPLGFHRARITTYLIKRREDHSAPVARFLERAQTMT